MYYRGKIRAGVVALEDGATLPEGTPVLVEPVAEETRLDQPEIDPLFRIGELAVETGISDLSINVDHYFDPIHRIREENEKLEVLRAAVRRGDEQLDRGEGADYTPELLEKITEKAVTNAKHGKQINPDVVS